MAEQKPSPSNRLIREKSPYLLQHAHNPVDWYPWGEAAFEKAKKEDKPVLLSIGYSTCHWCHVMERESFENPRVAELMNQNFVSIKVDREERPDLDSVYMNYVMAVTGSGGWPMTVFLTPDKKPFYGGTYFPPEDRYGMPGFGTLLHGLADAWKNRRGEILKSAESAAGFLAKPTVSGPAPALTEEIFFANFERHKSSFDKEWGGFGGAPKFPRSPALSLLLRYWKRSSNAEALHMAEKTLLAMADGGIYDQLGGGFHRYSTDARWHLPHFERMLYDQALLVTAYLEAYRATRNERYARVAKETLDYVLREMTSPKGGFFSAQDADSADPDEPAKKREGAYFVWTKKEVENALPKKDAEIFSFVYGVEERGNVTSDPHGEFVKQNVLYAAHTAGEVAEKFRMKPEEAAQSLEEYKRKLLAVRSGRPAPYLDDKILTDWNGLMIAALARASRVFEDDLYRDAAVKAADFISRNLKDKKGRLLHRYRDGEARIPATLNDYAYLIYGQLCLYEATFDERWLRESRDLARQMIDLFWDKLNGGFFLTAKDAEALIVRPKEIYDGAVPSGNSMAALDFLLLSDFTGERRWQDASDAVFKTFAGEASAEPTSYPQALLALDYAIGPSSQIVIAGDPADPVVKGFLKEIYSRFWPNKAVLLRRPGAAAKELEALAPFVKGKNPVDGKPAVYVCRNHVCQLPVTDKAQLRKAIEA